MEPGTLLLLSALLSLSPWLMAPRRGPRPEVRGGKTILWWINAFFCAFWHRLDAPRFAPLPDRGPAILISNHTSGLDPMLLQASSRRVLGFLVLRDWYDFWVIRPMCRLLRCIPVERDGKDVAATRAALRALADGRVVPIFLEGRIVPCSGRELGEPKPGAAFLVLRARVPVVPAYIRGTPPTSSVPGAILTPSKSRVVYGPPIDLADAFQHAHASKAQLAEVSERLMRAIRDLKDQAEAVENPPTIPR